MGSVSMTEDCLNLNVWTAAARADERRPVLVWIYDGRCVGGYGSDRNPGTTPRATTGCWTGSPAGRRAVPP
ncbi:carboxylesterase family protein [Streptomyces mirabilis]|uniref:carboxylesterase family protein n=1 Tax=Streptomyces mirabilis TaxID=68239 RepID=UPI0036EB1F88